MDRKITEDLQGKLVVGSCGVILITDPREHGRQILLDDLLDLKMLFANKGIIAHGATAYPLLFEYSLAGISVDVAVYQPVFERSVRSDQLRLRYAELPLAGYLVYELDGALITLGDLSCIVQERSFIKYVFYGSHDLRCSFVKNTNEIQEKIRSSSNNIVR